jgi:tetratricopeptide (TPR) repeat protein
MRPEFRQAQRLRGLVLLNDHEFAKARDLSKKMLERDADDALSWGTKSDAELELGDTAAAIEAAQRMMDLKPNLPSYGRAAHLRWLQGDIAGAKRLYELAIASGTGQRDPEPRAWMIVQAAWLFWHEGDYAGAAAGFELAMTTMPEYAPALEGLGRTELARRNYPAAVSWLERARKAKPSVETSGFLGDAYALQGDTSRAKVMYEEAERAGRQHDPRTLAAFYTSHDRNPEAALAMARAEYALRKDVISKDVMAFALYRNGRFEEADKLAREVLATGTVDARMLYHAGVIRTAAASEDTQRAEGRKLMADALRRNPGFDPMLTRPMAGPLATKSNPERASGSGDR